MRILAPIIALVAASAAVASVTHAERHGRSRHDVELIASVTKGFGIAGIPVTGLYPGAARPLTVKVTNSYAFPIKVGAIRATVAASTNRPGCTGASVNMTVSTAGVGAIPLGAHKRKTVALRVTMPSTVADACQGATFSLAFRARATRA